MAILLNFKNVYVNIARKKILKDLDKCSISTKTFYEYRKFKKEIFKAQSRLAQLDSIVDRILLKSFEDKDK